MMKGILMKSKYHQSLSCVLILAGAAAGSASAQDPAELVPSIGMVGSSGHIYYNLVTGEQIVSLDRTNQTAPADAGSSEPIWSTYGQIPDCVQDAGVSTTFFFAFNDPNGTTAVSQAVEILQVGDIAKDTVVDCLTINWVTAIPDTWANGMDSSSGISGVEELAARWRVWDADDGRTANNSTRLPLIDFLFFNLPGNTPDNAAAGVLTGWTADVDLVAFGGSSTDLSFEIGDSDGDCQTAAFCNNDVDTNGDGIGDGVSVSNADRDFDGLPDSDLDGDGLFDWSWSIRTYLPGTGNDFDSDSDTGVLPASDQDTIGIQLGWPTGLDVTTAGGFDFDPSVPAAATGADGRFLISDGSEFTGSYFFGSFECPEPGVPYTPPSVFAFQLLASNASGTCNGDFNGDGQVDFFDISIYIPCFVSGGIGCDFDPDLNGDGNVDFFDVSILIQWYNFGCGGSLP